MEHGIETPTGSIPENWDQAVAGLFRSLGTDRFHDALRSAITQCCAFDSMIISKQQGSSPPKALYHDLDDVQAAISLTFYASGPYLLDPFFIACRENREPGAYGLMELAPETFFRSEYFRTFYRKIRVKDEVGILIADGADNWIVVSLARRPGQPKFSKTDTARINAAFGLLSAAVLRNWGDKSKPSQETDGTSDADRLQAFGADVLSPREAQIIRLILLGHSTPSAAAYLGIADGTVKVHRHHAYAKLGISSQTELFSLVTQFLTAQDS